MATTSTTRRAHTTATMIKTLFSPAKRCHPLTSELASCLFSSSQHQTKSSRIVILKMHARRSDTTRTERELQYNAPNDTKAVYLTGARPSATNQLLLKGMEYKWRRDKLPILGAAAKKALSLVPTSCISDSGGTHRRTGSDQ